MNISSIYEIKIISSLLFCIIFPFIAFIFTDWDYNTSKKNTKLIILYTVIELLIIEIFTFCVTKNIETYKEVYYLEYTIYYPGDKVTYKVDSCNHVYYDSYKGTNRITYYSIPKKDTYGTATTAPILIDKIIKK